MFAPRGRNSVRCARRLVAAASADPRTVSFIGQFADHLPIAERAEPECGGCMGKCARVIRRRGRNFWEGAWCIVEFPSSREDSGERERRAREHEVQWSDNRMGGALSGEAKGAGTGPDAVSSGGRG